VRDEMIHPSPLIPHPSAPAPGEESGKRLYAPGAGRAIGYGSDHGPRPGRGTAEMPPASGKSLLPFIRGLAGSGGVGDATDGQLVDWFLNQRHEAAFRVLVERHGPMVMSVCRRVLDNEHDAEDAFQAAFLVLARKAATVRPRGSVANWLYGVAYRTAQKARVSRARAAAARRRATERLAAMAERTPTEDELWHDLQPVLDQELHCLPDAYRVAVVLCDLEGKSRKEAARQLGWPEGTL